MLKLFGYTTNYRLLEQKVLKRVDDVSKLLKQLGESIFSLSGGEKQKIACGSATAIEKEVYVFGEPSSNVGAYAITNLRKVPHINKSYLPV